MEKGNTPPRSEDEVKMTKEEMEAVSGQEWSGICKWFNVARGFGFLTPDNINHDVFVHQVNLFYFIL